MTSLRYDAKLMYTLPQTACLLALWTLTALVYASLFLKAPPGLRGHGAMAMLEMALPLLELFAVGHAATLEWEERSIELSLSYPGGGAGLLVRRLAVGASLAALVVTATLGVFLTLVPEMGHPGPANVWRVAWTVVPPALFVAAVGLLASVAAKHYVAGLGAGLLVWGLNLVNPGILSEELYLFQASRPMPGVSLVANRFWLTAAAAVVVALALALWSRRERALR